MLARIGKYEIRAELGKGGFGQVYLALDPTMDRLVAIKVLSAGGDSSLLIRFQTEATAAGNLNHKNIVTIYEFGEDRGMFFLAMEYLAGKDLQKVIDSAESRSVLDKMRIMTQIAEGLLCAHRGGVVHRDIKPANVMLLPDGNVKIMDFGIARMTGENSARLTQTGYLIGSVSHMAPEQFRGVEADVLCDIWAYGTIYYELLTGENPFHATDAPSTMYRITNVVPDSVRRLCPGSPEALDRVITGLLEKDRVSRYQSLEDVLFETAPILLDLQKAEVDHLASQARALIAGTKIDEAHQVIRRVLALDPMHVEGRVLLEQLQNEVRLRSTRVRVEALRQKAEKAFTEHNYGEAIQALGSALQINPKDTALRQRLTELQRVQEQRDKAERLLQHAQSELELQKLTSAFQSANEALNAEPDNPAAKGLVSRIESAIAERDSQRRLKEGLTRVRGLLVVEALDEAIDVLEDLAKHEPEHQQVRELLARAHQRREARERRLSINAGIETARASIRSGDFESAIATLEGLAKEFPDETSVAEMLAYAQDEFQAKVRAAKIKALGNEAWAALKTKNFEAALQLVRDGLASYPGNEQLVRLQEVILAAQAEHDREDAIRKALEESALLESANRLDDALTVLDAALRDCAGHAELQKAREELRRKIEEWERKRRADAIQEALTKARGMVAGGKAESATRLLANATATYPNEPELASLLDWAREEQKRQHEKQGVNEILSRAVALEKHGDVAQALEAVEGGLLTYPSSAVLTDAAMRLQTLVRLNQDLEAIRQPMARKDWATALTLLAGAMERHPGEEALSRLADQARREERDAAVEAVCAQARRELDAQDLDQARETIAGGLLRFGAHPRLIALETEANLGLERRRNLESVRHLCKSRDWESAEAILRKMLDRDASDNEARALWDGVSKERHKERRWRLREEGREGAHRALREQRFEEAEARLRSLQKEFPEDLALAEDLRRVAEARQRRTREEAYLAGRQVANDWLKAQKFEAAIGELQKLLHQFPGDDALEGDLKASLAAKQDHERREICERGRRKAAEYLTRREFDHAIRCLEVLLEQFPGDLAIKEDLASARGAKELFAQRQLLDQQVQELEKLYRKGDAQGVKQLVSRVGVRTQDPRVRELIDWADAEIARLAREVTRESAETLRDRRRRKTSILIGIGAAVILSAVAVWLIKSSGGSSGLALSSPEIAFHIEAGSTAIVSQTIVLKGESKSEAWSSSTSNDWLSATPQHGTTPASIIVSVNPAHLDPGSHFAQLIFAGRAQDSKTTVSVSVIVERKHEEKKVETGEAPAAGKQQITTKPTQAKTKLRPEQKAADEPLNTFIAPAPPPPAEKPKPVPAIVDCHAATYRGLHDGALSWVNGSLDPNGVVALRERGEILAGGRVSGQPLPGCDVTVSLDTNEVEIVEKPSLENGFRLIKLRNKSTAPISNIVVRWHVK
jgi:serine/threonine protein kinase